MLELRDKETGAAIGTITEEQLLFLTDALVEESEEDKDYYVNKATLEMLEEMGADSGLLTLLSQALGTRDEMEIAWSRT